MGIYVNPGNHGFEEARNSRIYVDKSGMIEYMNSVLDTTDKFICVSRPRRFGKSMALEMLAAYYDGSCNSEKLFEGMKISRVLSYEQHRNRYDVLKLDIQWLRSITKGKGILNRILTYLQREVIAELKELYPDSVEEEEISLPEVLTRINRDTGRRFIILIDEWDCLFREEQGNEKLQEEYITFLRGLFKGSPAERYICLAYMTGILPIKKYGTQSALNHFREFSMLDAGELAEYAGFTGDEVRALCGQYGRSFEDARYWYDGYRLGENLHVYNPKSVTEAVHSGRFRNYWTQTETYESLLMYIGMDFDGLKEDIVSMLGGGNCQVDSGSFQNDMTSFRSKDDVLTLLVHLGYLSYDETEETVSIPNEEIRQEFARAVRQSDWKEVAGIIRNSMRLLEATIAGDETAVAEMVEAAHTSVASAPVYNDENSLSCTVMLTYIAAKNDYLLIREFPSGKGFADIVFLPKRGIDKPPMVVELKWDQSADGAIAQIKEKKYSKDLEDFGGDILLVGISYDRATKIHDCKIEVTVQTAGEQMQK